MSKSPDAFRTISEVAEWLGTPAHVLRFWESKFAQVKPIKRAGGRRYYRPADMELLGGIKKLLHDDGMTIKGVQKVLREHGVRHVAALSVNRADGEDLIEDALDADVEAPFEAVDAVDDQTSADIVPFAPSAPPVQPDAAPSEAAPLVAEPGVQDPEMATPETDPATIDPAPEPDKILHKSDAAPEIAAPAPAPMPDPEPPVVTQPDDSVVPAAMVEASGESDDEIEPSLPLDLPQDPIAPAAPAAVVDEIPAAPPSAPSPMSPDINAPETMPEPEPEPGPEAHPDPVGATEEPAPVAPEGAPAGGLPSFLTSAAPADIQNTPEAAPEPEPTPAPALTPAPKPEPEPVSHAAPEKLADLPDPDAAPRLLSLLSDSTSLSAEQAAAIHPLLDGLRKIAARRSG